MVDVQQWNVTAAAADAQNPTGAWAGAPSLAATTVGMTNTSGHVVFADVAGGTVTAIKVNGVSSGLTAGAVRLRPEDVLSVTYSVAPTLTWTYEGPPQVKPAGTWSGAPSIAASTVSMQNTSGSDIEVIITSGTWTVVKKNGVTLTSFTSAIFSTVPAVVRLKPNQTIAITYSVAPTLEWIYA